jgi:hypothetical protein
MRIRLSGGAYTARSVIASAQRSCNLFSEQGPAGAIIDAATGQGVGQPLAGGVSAGLMTLYPAPGLMPIGVPATAGPARGLYRANSGTVFYACGATLYTVSSAWTCTAIGTIGDGSTPVSMGDNGQTLVLVDGTANGYTVDLTTLAFAAMSSAPYPAGNAPTTLSTMVYGWLGADRIAVIDGYLLFNQPGTQQFYSTYNNEIVFDSLYIAAKDGFSDNLVAAVVNQRTIWLIGERTTEMWFNAGAADFPFAIMTGPFVHHGCSAKYSIAQINEVIYWLSQDQAGANILLRTQGYNATRVSTHAIETEWAGYATTADATAFCFQHHGHSFYQINFPSADRSWRFDETTGEWAQVLWSDSNGAEHRHRAACAAWAYGVNVVADWQTGALYALDAGTYTDNGAPIVCRRGFPHIVGDGDRVFYRSMMLDCEVGDSVGTFDPPLSPYPDLGDTSPQVLLRWSDDRGRTWNNPVPASLGATGEYITSVQYNRLGMGRDRVFEVCFEASAITALQGAFITLAKVGS